MSFVIRSSDTQAIAVGSTLSVTASDTIATGLLEVKFAHVQLVTDPVAAAQLATVALSPTPGSIIVKTWTSAAAAATSFGATVHWMAFGR